LTPYDFIPNPLQILAGVFIGFILSAPVGPVNVLCVQRAIERGFFGGMAAGIGAMLGDGLMSFFAAWGMSAVSHVVTQNRSTIYIVGGVVLALFGLKLFMAEPKMIEVKEEMGSLSDHGWVIPQTFFLTITNPGAILGVFAIFGSLSGALGIDTFPEAVEVTLAVVGGAFLWWFTLSSLIARVRHRITQQMLKRINQIAGLVLLGFAVVVVAKLFLPARLYFPGR